MTTSPNALCFGENFPATGQPCCVELSSTGLTVGFNADRPDVGGLSVPFSALTVSAGGLNHDRLVLKWGGGAQAHTLYLKDPDLIKSFRSSAPPEMTRDVEMTAANVRKVRSRQRTVWTILLAMLAGLVLLLWFGSDLLVDLAVDRIPIEWEQKLGESAYRDFLIQQTVLKEGPAVEAVNEITRRLTEKIPEHPYKFDVSVVKSEVVNAFALPGGYVIVFTGLLQKAESGEEVAGVLSHELNHVLQRHGLERLLKQLGLVAIVTIILGDQQGLIGLMQQVGVELLTLKFGRAQETEADVQGLRLLHRAKIDPSGMITFFQRLSEKEDGRVEWLSTHPMSAGRAALLKIEMVALPKSTPEPFTFQWNTVQESLGVAPVAAP